MAGAGSGSSAAGPAVAASSGKADPGGWLTASTFAALDRFVGCFEVTWRSVRSDLVARVLWGLPENIAADIGLVSAGAHYLARVMGLYGLRHA